MWVERKTPSSVALALTIIPAVLICAIFYLTDWLSESPTRVPPPYSTILPLFLAFTSALLAGMAYFTTRDEEPEWEPLLLFKLVEGIDIALVILSLLLAVLVALFYFL